jgi:hypothetical protein
MWVIPHLCALLKFWTYTQPKKKSENNKTGHALALAGWGCSKKTQLHMNFTVATSCGLEYSKPNQCYFHVFKCEVVCKQNQRYGKEFVKKEARGFYQYVVHCLKDLQTNTSIGGEAVRVIWIVINSIPVPAGMTGMSHFRRQNEMLRDPSHAGKNTGRPFQFVPAGIHVPPVSGTGL